MSKKKKIVVQLNIMLLKQGLALNKRADFINSYDEKNVISHDQGKYLIYKKISFLDYPRWLKAFHKKIWGKDDIFEQMSRTNSEGLSIFIPLKEEDATYLFVINYGTGRFNIKKEMIDKTFGIYTSQQIIQKSKAKIKNAQSRVLEQNPVNKSRMFGKDADADDFFLSMEDNEVVRELNITINDPEDFSNMIGKYSSLNVKFLFDESNMPCLGFLSSKLKILLNIYKSITDEEIKKLFKGLKPLYDESTQDLCGKLEKELANKTDNFFLFEAEIDFEYGLVSGFKYKFNNGNESELYSKLSIDDYLSKKSSPKIDDLEKDMIILLDEDGKEIKEWSIMECLYGEMSHNGKMYILSYGDWFEIGKEKFERIKSNIKSVEDQSFNVSDSVRKATRNAVEEYKKTPIYESSKKIPRERLFNEKLCGELSGEFFDQIDKQISLYEDKFEVCDIFLPKNKEFIHSKIKKGSQSLSHLFNQGYVSASSFAKFSDRFTEKANEKIINLNNRIESQSRGYAIRYLIINESSSNRLPFFSKMTLDDKITTLRAEGFDVKLTWVNGVFKN